MDWAQERDYAQQFGIAARDDTLKALTELGSAQLLLSTDAIDTVDVECSDRYELGSTEPRNKYEERYRPVNKDDPLGASNLRGKGGRTRARIMVTKESQSSVRDRQREKRRMSRERSLQFHYRPDRPPDSITYQGSTGTGTTPPADTTGRHVSAKTGAFQNRQHVQSNSDNSQTS